MTKIVWLKGKCPHVLLSKIFYFGLWDEILTASSLAEAGLQSGL